MKKSILIFLLSSVVLSCSTSDDPDDQDPVGMNITANSISMVKGMNDDPDDLDQGNDNVLHCYFEDTIGFDHAVIRNESEYQALVDAIISKGVCHSEEVPDIDFSQYTLIGKYVSGGGCSATFNNKVYKDTENKTINYLISSEFTGACQMFILSWNWMLIPKIGPDYTVEFMVAKND